MTCRTVIQRILQDRLVPIVRAKSTEEALSVVEALVAGGIGILEITITFPHALTAIEKAVKSFGERLVLGAGTVLDSETARVAILAGAEFVVTPALNIQTIELCKRYSKIAIPGALTPTEVLCAWQAGADLVKIFPCDTVGGPRYIKALKGPFPQISLMPTGGVHLATAADYLAAGAAALGVGSELVDKSEVANRNFAAITENARSFLSVTRIAEDQPFHCGL
jgi:2-dehydro-3-deoxyphosphogluconate aldolase / (4S)-4-hydroxy-2-oxoglutarate aldolase